MVRETGLRAKQVAGEEPGTFGGQSGPALPS